MRPHFDPRLRGSKKLYATFLAALHGAGMLGFGDEETHTLAPLFVPKRDDSQKLRLVLDTRRVNRMFHDPDHSLLPTAGVWNSLHINPGDKL